MASLKAKVWKTIVDNALFAKGDRVVVAVSGGADSVALLDLLASLGELELDLVVAHLNHSLRGEESDGDEAFVRRLADRYGLPVDAVRVDVRKLGRELGLSLEEAGREARYDFLSAVARRHGAQAIALAHHADDQAETVLIRLLRGTGTTGLRAMAAKSGGCLVRPFLDVCRCDIDAYLGERGLVCRHDSSNDDAGILRNRIRHELIPSLATYNPAIRDRLAELARICARDEAVLEQIARASFDRVARSERGGIALDIPSCSLEPEGVRYRVYRHAVRKVKGGLERIGSAHLTDIDGMVSGARPHMTLCLPDNVRVFKSYGILRFCREGDGPASGFPWQEIWEPGEFLLPCGFRLTVEEVQPENARNGISRDSTCIDGEAAPFPWLVRTFEAGDRIVPVGMKGHKKVKDLFIDEKIPMERRRRIPLLFSAGTLIWVAGVRASAAAALTAETRIALSVRVHDM